MSRSSVRNLLACCLVLSLVAPAGLVGRWSGMDSSAHALRKRYPLKRVRQRATISSVSLRRGPNRIGDDVSRGAAVADRRLLRESIGSSALASVRLPIDGNSGRLRPLRC